MLIHTGGIDLFFGLIGDGQKKRKSKILHVTKILDFIFLTFVFKAEISEREAKAALDGELPGFGFVGGIDIRTAGLGVTSYVHIPVIVRDEIVYRWNCTQLETPYSEGQSQAGVSGEAEAVLDVHIAFSFDSAVCAVSRGIIIWAENISWGQAGEELDSVEQSGEETADDIIYCRVLVVIVLVVVGVTQSVFQTVLQCLFERAPSTAPGHGQRQAEVIIDVHILEHPLHSGPESHTIVEISAISEGHNLALRCTGVLDRNPYTGREPDVLIVRMHFLRGCRASRQRNHRQHHK